MKLPPLPGPLAALLRTLPEGPPALAFCTLLNLALGRWLPLEPLAPLDGRRLRLELSDAGVGFDFMLREGRFRPCPKGGEPALRIRSGLADYLDLLFRRVDPDTLFFKRRLELVGDTALALQVKNTLDAIDWPPHFDWPPRFGPLK